MHKTRFFLAQINGLVGDIEGNTQRVLEVYAEASAAGADLVIFPELMLSGYPPEDLLLRASMQARIARALEQVCAAVKSAAMVVGLPWLENDRRTNRLAVIQSGRVIGTYDKQCLPNYQVFDEHRYFVPGIEPLVVEINGVKVGFTICEDIWFQQPAQQARQAGAEVLVNINASPFSQLKQQRRIETLKTRASETGLPIAYVNWVAGQDELVFDGGSLMMDCDGAVAAEAVRFEEHILQATLVNEQGDCYWEKGDIAEPLDNLAAVYRALVLGVRDYVNKNGFKGVVLGLSGGIDSALTLAVAVDALGKERVEAVMMPFRYTSQMSLEDAKAEAVALGVEYKVISIEPAFNAFQELLAEEFAGLGRDTTEENLQARSRGVLLMAISNKKGYLVLTTGNKSEMSVGYATLYGDMAGGFDVLKDVPKTLVFALSRYRNTLGPVIPERVITRPPSAELAPDQKDEDSLPPYEVLDQILAYYVEQDWSAQAIIDAGFAEADVRRVIRLVDINEYKRRQAAIGVRITERGFGKDRRYPITNGWKIGD